MMIRSMINKRSVIYNWIVSYILILLIPIIVTGVVYFISKDIIEDEINNSNNLLVKNIRDTMDSIINDAQRLSNEVSANRSIVNVLDINKFDLKFRNYELYNAANELSRYRLFDSNKNRMYIYFNNLETVITPKCVYNETDFYNLYLSSEKYTHDQWLEAMTSSNNRENIVMPYTDDSLGNVNMLGFMFTFPVNLKGHNAANLVVLLNLNDYLNMDNSNGYMASRNVQIIDVNGNVMAGKTIDNELSAEDYKKMVNDYGTIEKTLDSGKKIVISYTSSHINNWKYIIETPELVFWQKAQYIRNIMLGSIAICILFGGGMALFFLKKNYNPLGEVVAYFTKNLYTNTKIVNNEYLFIRDVFDETLAQKDKIFKKLQQQNSVIKSNYFAQILKGKNLIVPVHEFLSTYDITFKYSHFTVMVIYIDNIDEEFWIKDVGNSIDIYNISKFIITNVVEEILNRNYCSYMAEVDDVLACLINSGYDMSYQRELKSMIDEANKFIEENYRIKLSFAVSTLHETFDGISEAYSEAISAMEYLRVMGINETVFYNDISHETGNKYYYPVEKEYQLINCIKASNYKDASTILEDIIHKNTVNNSPSLKIIRCLMFDLISTILKVVNEIEKSDEKDYFESANTVGELMKCNAILEMKNKMLQILKDTCDYLSKNNTQPNYKFRDMIIEIIEKNYSDPNLGINSIADEIGKNAHYLSRLFKEQTGESIVDYLNKIRIQKVKELLKENKWNQEEIANKVGYANVRTFQRIFKKQEGTSPGKVKI